MTKPENIYANENFIKNFSPVTHTEVNPVFGINFVVGQFLPDNIVMVDNKDKIGVYDFNKGTYGEVDKPKSFFDLRPEPVIDIPKSDYSNEFFWSVKL